MALVAIVAFLLSGFFPTVVAAADCWSFEGLDYWAGVVQQVVRDGRGRPAGAVVAFTTPWTPNPGDILQVEGRGVGRVEGSSESPVWGTVWANPTCIPVGPSGYTPNPSDRSMSLVQEAVEADVAAAVEARRAERAAALPEATAPAASAEPRTYTYWDDNASYWVFKVERPGQLDVFLKLGDSKCVARDGQVFWDQGQEVIATFVTVYGPEFACSTWIDQHGGPPQVAAQPQPATQPTAVCPGSTTEVARIILEWKPGQPEDEVSRLVRELKQLSPSNGWRFDALSVERARALMAHDNRVVDVNGVRYNQPGTWSPKTEAGTIWFNCTSR